MKYQDVETILKNNGVNPEVRRVFVDMFQRQRALEQQLVELGMLIDGMMNIIQTMTVVADNMKTATETLEQHNKTEGIEVRSEALDE